MLPFNDVWIIAFECRSLTQLVDKVACIKIWRGVLPPLILQIRPADKNTGFHESRHSLEYSQTGNESLQNKNHKNVNCLQIAKKNKNNKIRNLSHYATYYIGLGI